MNKSKLMANATKLSTNEMMEITGGWDEIVRDTGGKNATYSCSGTVVCSGSCTVISGKDTLKGKCKADSSGNNCECRDLFLPMY